MCKDVKMLKRAIKSQEYFKISETDLFDYICDIVKGKNVKKLDGRIINHVQLYRYAIDNKKRLVYYKDNSTIKIIKFLSKQGQTSYENIDKININKSEFCDVFFSGFDFDEFTDFLVKLNDLSINTLNNLNKCKEKIEEIHKITSEIPVIQSEIDKKIKNKEIILNKQEINELKIAEKPVETSKIHTETKTEIKDKSCIQFESFEEITIIYPEKYNFLKKIRYQKLENVFLQFFNDNLRGGIDFFQIEFSQSMFLKILTEIKNKTFNIFKYKQLLNFN